MKPFEYLVKIKATNRKIEMLMFEEKPVPNELNLEVNKLICDYNEAIKNLKK